MPATKKPESQGTTQHIRLWDLAVRLVIPIMLAWAIWVTGIVLQHKEDMAVFKATIFTSADGRLLLDTIMELKSDMLDIKAELLDIKSRMVVIETKIGRE